MNENKMPTANTRGAKLFSIFGDLRPQYIDSLRNFNTIRRETLKDF